MNIVNPVPAGPQSASARVRPAVLNPASWSPGVFVAVVLVLFAVVWLAELSATSLAAPVDNIEQLVWQHALAWGYYKHPPLPTFIAWVAVRLFGASAWTTYILGAVFTLTAMAVYWRLMRHLRGTRHATLALLAGLCITFYNGRLYYYNHNIVLLLLVVASAALIWRAFEERQLRWWLAFGVVMGLGALTKYQIAVTAVSAFCFWLWQQGWRDRLHRVGALAAALISLVMFTPHLLWLPTHDFGPITYAVDSSLGVHLSLAQRMMDSFSWLVDEVCNRAAPALLLLAVCLPWRRQALAALQTPAPADARLRASRALLVCWGVVPLVFMPAVGLAFGSDLQLQWGTPFLLFLVPCAMEFVRPSAWRQLPLSHVLKPFLALQLLLLAVNVATSPVGFRAVTDSHWRTFAAHRLAHRVAKQSRALLGGPVRVVIGTTGEAGALALQLSEKPVVLVDGRYDRSPWVSRDLVAACGALELAHEDKLQGNGWHAVGKPFGDLYWRVIQPEDPGAGCNSALAASAR